MAPPDISPWTSSAISTMISHLATERYRLGASIPYVHHWVTQGSAKILPSVMAGQIIGARSRSTLRGARSESWWMSRGDGCRTVSLKERIGGGKLAHEIVSDDLFYVLQCFTTLYWHDDDIYIIYFEIIMWGLNVKRMELGLVWGKHYPRQVPSHLVLH